MTGHLLNLPFLRDPDFMELVWENGQVLIRGLSSKITKKSSPFSSRYLSRSSKARIQLGGKTSTIANGSKDGVADSTFADPISGLSSLTKLDPHGSNAVLGADKQCYDKQLIDSNIVPRSSLKQYETSFQFVGSKEKKSRIDEEKNWVNFSILRSPQARIESNRPSSGATRAEDLEGNVRSLPPMSSNPFENEGNFMAKKMKPILPDSEPQKELLPDEQSEAVPNTRLSNKVHEPSSTLAPDNTAFKANPEQRVASSSLCSRGASNCPTYTFKRRCEGTDLSKNIAMEEPQGTTKAAPVGRGSKGAKRKRKTEVHNLSDRRRRDKINKKTRALKGLIPNCNKVDKASMLDEAIEYLKTLELQLRMMSIGNGVYLQPMMFPSPSAMQHINAQHLAGYSPMTVGMGMRMQMGLGCGVPAQFPTSLMPGAAPLPGIPEARLNMLGLLRSMSRSSFVSSAGSFTPQSVQPPRAGESAAAAAEAQVVLIRFRHQRI